MDLEAHIQRMTVFPSAIRALLAGMSDDDARVKPESGAWSILEIVWHLALEDAQDFRPRLESTLEDPARAWSPIDPEGEIVKRKCNEGTIRDALSEFEKERADSVRFLLSLIGQTTDWSRTYTHPKVGAISAGDLMASWALHDALHLAQLSKRLCELARRDSGDFSTTYATG